MCSNLTSGEHAAGITATIKSTFVMPKFCAENPIRVMKMATIPHENPLIKPEITLLYSGRTFCARYIVTGNAIIVNIPISANIIRDSTGMVLYVKINKIISGNVEIIEK